MIVELWVERDVEEYTERMIKSWITNSLDTVKAEVEILISKWENELDDWAYDNARGDGDEEDTVFESKILPGLEEGDDVVLKIDGKTEWMYTDQWEAYRV